MCHAFNMINIQENTTLNHDAKIILDCWKTGQPLLFQYLIVQAGEFESTSQLYDDLCMHVKKIHNISLVDTIMPYIDHYIDYYDTITYW